MKTSKRSPVVEAVADADDEWAAVLRPVPPMVVADEKTIGRLSAEKKIGKEMARAILEKALSEGKVSRRWVRDEKGRTCLGYRIVK